MLGSAKFREAALFLSIVGGANFLLLSFIPVILYFSQMENFGSPDHIPWAHLCGVAGLLLGEEEDGGGGKGGDDVKDDDGDYDEDSNDDDGSDGEDDGEDDDDNDDDFYNDEGEDDVV